MQLTEVELILGEAWDTAHQAMRSGKFDEAVASLRKIIKIDRHNAAAYNRLGIIRAKQRKLRRSTINFKKAVKFEPESAAAHHNLALIYYERKKYKEAKQNFQIALNIESSLAARYIALAKVEERLGNSEAVIKNLKQAAAMENSNEVRRLYVNAMRSYQSGEALSDEIFDALQYNKIPWEYAALENYQNLLQSVDDLCKATQQLIGSLNRKKLSPRSKHTSDLGIIFLHNVGACTLLLGKNYSHAAFTLARSIYEIYLKTSFALRLRSYRGYAEMDASAVQGRVRANQRLITQLSPTDPQAIKLAKENRKLNRQLNSLRRRYRGLAQLPSFRQMAIQLDGGHLGDYYSLFVRLYEKGSESTHSEKKAIQRAVTMSGTDHAGLFADSYLMGNILIEVLESYGLMLCGLPEITPYIRRKYLKKLNEITGSNHTL